MNNEQNELLETACKTAQLAASYKLNEMLAAGPKYSVHNDDFSGKLGPAIGTMLDNCGGAWIVLPGKSPLVNYIKKHFKNASQHGGVNTRYEGTSWTMSKGIYKGYTLHLSYSLSSRQEMGIHEAANSAAVEYLKANGIECSMHSYID